MGKFNIPFLDLHKINKPYEKAFKENFQTFLDSGHYVLGSSVKEFEKEFASYCGVKHCVGVGNGLDALTLILKGFVHLGKLKEGDEVMVAANTFIATILAVKHAGLTPILLEPDEKTFNLDPDEVEKHLSKNSRAILVTHLYGQIADMQKLKELAQKHNLLLIEDAAQAHGAVSNNGKRAGNLADAAAFSFYPAKNLGALGDGGTVTTNDEDLAGYILKLRNYGTASKYVNEIIGFNSRLDELQATFLSEKLKVLEEDNSKRREIARRYSGEVKNNKIELPFWDGSKNHVFHLFVVRVSDREDFCGHLEENGIGYGVHYPIPPHQQKALEEFSHLQFPITEKIHQQVVSIPLNPVMTDEEVSQLIFCLNSY